LISADFPIEKSVAATCKQMNEKQSLELIDIHKKSNTAVTFAPSSDPKLHKFRNPGGHFLRKMT